MDRLIGGSPRFDELRREWMREPDEVAAMLRLRGLGWGVRRIAAEFGCSHVTVRRYLAAGDAAACEGSGWAGGLARRAVSAAPWQRRRRPPGPRAREGHRGQLAHGRAGGRAAAAGDRGRGAGERCASRRRLARCRSTSARRGWRSAARTCGCICSGRRWATRGAVSVCRDNGRDPRSRRDGARAFDRQSDGGSLQAW